MSNEQTIPSRISKIIEIRGKTVNSFAKKVGVDPGNLRKMLSNNQKITEKTIDKILKAYPEINRVWLLTGEGNMLVGAPVVDMTKPDKQFIVDEVGTPDPSLLGALRDRGIFIPLINIDSVGGVWSENQTTSSEQYTERLVPFEGARPGDVAIMQSGDSMSPNIPAGSMMHIRKIDQWREYLDYDSVYVLWLRDDRRITKLIRKFEDDPKNYILCCSYNPNAAAQELPRTFIKEVWKVVNVLIPKGW